MRKKDPFRSQDQRHNRKKEKKDRKTDSDQQNEEVDRYEVDRYESSFFDILCVEPISGTMT